MFSFILTLIRPTYIFFFLNDPPTTKISPLSLHDALPIFLPRRDRRPADEAARAPPRGAAGGAGAARGRRRSQRALPGLAEHAPGPAARAGRRRRGSRGRSEEHTSEIQSPCNLVCRLLLGK